MNRPAVTISLLIALAAACGGAVLHGGFPLSDNAMFEYGGLAIVRGEQLYRDVWDNKLPGVFIADALWQTLFGENYRLHAAAESAVGLASSLLLGLIVRQFGGRWWPLATAAAAIVLCVVAPQYNSVESYALALILVAVIAARAGRAVGSGIAVALASLCWVPAIVMLVPLATLVPRAARLRLGIAAVALLAAVAATMTAFVGVTGMRMLAASWVAYVPSAVAPAHHRLPAIGIALDLADGLIGSGTAALAVLACAAFARPRTAAQRFALWWLGAALAGTLVGTRFYQHYFIPSTAPFIFALCVFPLRLRGGRALFAGLALVAALLTARDVRSIAAGRAATAAHTEAVGALLRRALGVNATLAVDDYAPGLYLAADARLRDPYEIVAGPNAAFLARAGVAPDPPAAVQVLVNPHARPDPGRVEVCAALARPWRLFAAARFAPRFARCAGEAAARGVEPPRT